MAELKTPEQNRLLGVLTDILRGREQIQSQMRPTALGTVLDLILPRAETVEKLSYGDPLFRTTPMSNIPITADKQYLADVAGMIPFGVPSAKPTQRAMQQIVREIQTTPPRGSVQLPEAGLLAPQAPRESAAMGAVQTDNFKNWFGDWQSQPELASKVVSEQGAPLVVYHGTQRPDRVGTQFKKSRATSGPMSFFTDNPELASSYAKGKQDTSLAYEDTSYADWFKKKVGRSTLNLEQVGARMSPQERQEVIEKLRRVGLDDQGNIVVGEGIVSDSTFDFMLKDPREGAGNPLKLANKLWLESGALYGKEEEFSKVLNAIGLKGFDQDFPTASYPSVYPVYLDIKNPLDTSSINESTIAALEQASKKQRTPSSSYGADPWDKRNRDPKEWIKQLKEDYANGQSSMVWTSIPDWVTKTLKSQGFDGIKDVGGKSGGTPHTVWIPFEENQVKSATGNIGKFSKETANILKGVAPTVGAGLLGASMMEDEGMY